MSRGFPSSVLLLLQIGRRLFCSNNNGTDDFLKNILLSHRIVEMLYHSINNGGCGFLLLWFLVVRKNFWKKTGSSCCNIIHETGFCHLDMTHFFCPVLSYINNKSTKWRFLTSLFINRSFNTFRSIQCEQFKEKLSEIRDWDQADRHFAAHYRLFLNYNTMT